MRFLSLSLLTVLPLLCNAWIFTTPAKATRKSCTISLAASTQDLTTSSVDIQTILDLAQELGPVGVRQSQENQQRILDAALALDSSSAKAPARVPHEGVHKLLYSAAPGGSSGKLGFIDGRVTQAFVDDATFINAVEVGPLKIALTAAREVKNDTTIKVTFLKTTVSLFGNKLIEKEISGGGVWKYLYAGVITDKNGEQKLVRIMQTPSLFVLEQPLGSS